MMVKRVMIPVVVLLLATGTGLVVLAESMQILNTNYYLLSLGQTAPNIQTLVDAAQTDSFTVVLYEGDRAVGYRGAEPTTEATDSLLTSDRLLVADGDRFYLRVVSEVITYTVRPGARGHQLVLSPHQDQALTEALTWVLTELQAFGLFGGELDLQFQTFAKDALKGPAPPQDARIDSDLYWLTVAEDWFTFAARKGLALTGLRVEVFAEALPDQQVPAEFSPYVVGETEAGAKLLLPIDRLVALASSEGIGLVRLPYRPSIP